MADEDEHAATNYVGDGTLIKTESLEKACPLVPKIAEEKTRAQPGLLPQRSPELRYSPLRADG